MLPTWLEDVAACQKLATLHVVLESQDRRLLIHRLCHLTDVFFLNLRSRGLQAYTGGTKLSLLCHLPESSLRKMQNLIVKLVDFLTWSAERALLRALQLSGRAQRSSQRHAINTVILAPALLEPVENH